MFARRPLRRVCLATAILLGVSFLQAAPPAEAALPYTVRVKNSLSEARSRAPVTWSIPFAPEDAVFDPLSISLTRNGEPVPIQATVMSRWGGGPEDSTRPISWLLIDLHADLAPGEEAAFEVERRVRAGGTSPLRVARNDAAGIVIETGAATYTISKTAFRIFDGVALSGSTTFPSGGGVSYNGSLVAPPVDISVEHAGPYRISLRVKGAIAGDLGFTARMQFHRDLAEVKIDFRLENLTPYSWLDNQPNCNSYGTPGSVSFDDLSLVIPAARERDYRYSSGELGVGPDVSGTFSTSFSLVQESSGDRNWNLLASEAPRLQSGARKRASTVTADGVSQEGPNQLGEWLDSGGVTVAMPDLWQNFPKALRAREGRVEAGLFPAEFSRNHELRSGEFKTHTVWVRHHAAAAAGIASRARSALSPLRLLPDGDLVARTHAAGVITGRMTSAFPDYERGVDSQIHESPDYSTRPWESTAPTVLDAISLNQHYGWVDYGDVPTDFEPFNSEGTLGSPYNLKYDMLRGFIQQALRTDDPLWWRLSAAGARHAADIDMLHSKNRGRTASRAWPDGGLYGHGYHDERGNVNPHRNFMNPSVSMSGPPPGMFLWAHLTGDTLVLDSAIEAADSIWWKITHSAYPGDGGCAATLSRCDPDGPDFCEGYEEADGGRTGGNAMKALLSAYLATGDREYLDTIAHLASYLDCMEGRSGLCCNRYHMQTTMMGALGHYLLVRQWLGLGDDAAARSVLGRRLAYMKTRLHSPLTGAFSMCYLCENDPDIEDCDESIMCPIWDNWLLNVADAFALGSLILGDRSYLTAIARPLFDAGSRHPMGGDSTLAYHATKELANQAGYGGIFLHAWQQAQSACSLTCGVTAAPAGLTVQFTASVQSTGCSGSVVYSWSFGDGQQSASQSPSHTYPADGTYSWTFSAAQDGQSCSKAGTIAVSGASPMPYSYVIPAVARAPGALDSVWRTDLVAVNVSNRESRLYLTLVPSEGARIPRERRIGARGAQEWGDVIGTLFSPDAPESVSGVILIESESPLALSSRTYNLRASGTFGGYLPAIRTPDGISEGDTGYISHLKKSDAYRTNIGITNLGKKVLTASIQLFDGSGNPAGKEERLDVPAECFRQIDDIFTKSGAGNQPVAFAKVAVKTPGGRAWGYASVIDNQTGDPTLVPLQKPRP